MPLTLRGGGTPPPETYPGGPLSTIDTGRESAATSTPAPAPAAATGRTRADAVRDWIHVGACVLSGALVFVGFLLDPAGDADTGAETIAVVAESTDRFYWANTITAFGLAMVAAVGLAVLRLVRGRGRVLGTIGGLLLVIGGLGAAAGIFMYGAVLSAMVESDVDHEVLAELQDHLGESSRPGLAFFLGFASLLLGLLVSAVAFLVSKASHVAVPVLLLLGAVGIVVLGDRGNLAHVSDAVLALGLAGVGVTLWRATLGSRAA